MSKVVVLIPMYNFHELTDKCIELVKQNAGIEHEILVVDDCSAVEFTPKTEIQGVLRLRNRSGFTKAVNAGLRLLKLRYDYVLILNNDTEPEPDFLKHLVETAEQDKQIGIVGSARIASREPYKVFTFGADLITGTVYGSTEDETEASQCIFIPFCSVLISRECVEAVGLLDEKMINHCSDNDYCIRSIFMGFGVVSEPRSKVFHLQSVTINSLNIEPYEDQKVFIRKHCGDAMNEILDKIPLNYDFQKYGQIGFRQYEKGQTVLHKATR